MKNRKTLPDPCTQILSMGAWLCGSAITWLENSDLDAGLADVDLMVPPEKWLEACRLVRATGLAHAINRMGGLKITSPTPIDIWPGTIESLLSEITIPVEGLRLLRYRPFTMLAIGTSATPMWEMRKAAKHVPYGPKPS